MRIVKFGRLDEEVNGVPAQLAGYPLLASD